MLMFFGTNLNYLTKTLMRVQETTCFFGFVKRTWTTTLELAGAMLGMVILNAYAPWSRVANGHFPWTKFLHTSPCLPNGHGYHVPAKLARTAALTVAASTGESNTSLIWAASLRFTTHWSALQLARVICFGCGSPGAPNCHKNLIISISIVQNSKKRRKHRQVKKYLQAECHSAKTTAGTIKRRHTILANIFAMVFVSRSTRKGWTVARSSSAGLYIVWSSE